MYATRVAMYANTSLLTTFNYHFFSKIPYEIKSHVGA